MQIIRSMWTADETSFDGEFYEISGAVNQPKGVQTPIPMMIAGAGEKVTLKLVARYADASNILESPEALKRKYDILRKHCADAGRDYDTILRTTSTLCIIRDTDEEARALVPPGMEFAFPGDVASYGLVGSVDTVRERIAGLVRQFAAEFMK